ncbi:11130_t:CDS:2, partial [Entrophospora sp. SA101]
MFLLYISRKNLSIPRFLTSLKPCLVETKKHFTTLDRFVELTDIPTLSQVYKKGGFDCRIPGTFKHDISLSHNKTLNDKISLMIIHLILHAHVSLGYNLPAKYIIHTVGPVGEHEELLNSAYRQSLKVMIVNNLKSIAFPNISTGAYGYPRVGAAQVAMKTIRKWMEDFEHIEKIDRIIFCVFEESNRRIYEGLLPLYFPPPPEGSNNDTDILGKQEKENDAGTAEKQEEGKKLKAKLNRDTTPLYQGLYYSVDKIFVDELSWKDPLASQVISDNLDIVEKLSEGLKKGFMKLAHNMMPEPIPMVKKMCGEFVSNFITRENITSWDKLKHDGRWKEREEDIKQIVNEIF